MLRFCAPFSSPRGPSGFDPLQRSGLLKQALLEQPPALVRPNLHAARCCLHLLRDVPMCRFFRNDEPTTHHQLLQRVPMPWCRFRSKCVDDRLPLDVHSVEHTSKFLRCSLKNNIVRFPVVPELMLHHGYLLLSDWNGLATSPEDCLCAVLSRCIPVVSATAADKSATSRCSCFGTNP